MTGSRRSLITASLSLASGCQIEFWPRTSLRFLADCSGARYSPPNSIIGHAVRLVQSVRAAIRSCSRNHACAGRQ